MEGHGAPINGRFTKWVSGVTTPISGVITQLITGRGPPWRFLLISTSWFVTLTQS